MTTAQKRRHRLSPRRDYHVTPDTKLHGWWFSKPHRLWLANHHITEVRHLLAHSLKDLRAKGASDELLAEVGLFCAKYEIRLQPDSSAITAADFPSFKTVPLSEMTVARHNGTVKLDFTVPGNPDVFSHHITPRQLAEAVAFLIGARL